MIIILIIAVVLLLLYITMFVVIINNQKITNWKSTYDSDKEYELSMECSKCSSKALFYLENTYTSSVLACPKCRYAWDVKSGSPVSNSVANRSWEWNMNAHIWPWACYCVDLDVLVSYDAVDASISSRICRMIGRELIHQLEMTKEYGIYPYQYRLK